MAAAAVCVAIMFIYLWKQCLVFAEKIIWKDKKTTESTSLVLEYLTDLLCDLLDIAAISGENPVLLLDGFRKFLHGDLPNGSTLLPYLQPMANFKCHGIIDYLKANYENLSETELTFCAMICLRFPPHGIQMIYRQGHPASLYNRRFRLRKKLGLTEGDSSLEIFLEELEIQLARKEQKEIEMLKPRKFWRI